MELSELVAYAGEKYQIQEQHKWAEFPGFSVLCHPQTGKWVALLMRQWDTDSGRELQRCDLKCGRELLRTDPRPYLALPIRMQGARWLNIAFDERTESETVFRLFDTAIRSNLPQGAAIVLSSRLPAEDTVYRDTALPFASSHYRPPREQIPERLRQMRRLNESGGILSASRAEIFYRQAVFMADYEDDFPWTGELNRFFTTYQDLSTRQLRGYFSWRTKLRRGEFRPISASVAYLYLYELLNGIGAGSPEEVLEKLRAFEVGYLDSGFGDAQMRRNLRRWSLEFAVLNDLPPERTQETVDPELIAADKALAVLRDPQARADEEVFSALCTLGGKKTGESPVVTRDPERGRSLFARAWRAAAAYEWQGKDLFTLCFGEAVTERWYPLANAVYVERSRPKEREYVLDEVRSYRCRYGIWQVTAYDKRNFDRSRLQGFLHETDALFRRWEKTGRYLRENPADAWARPYIEDVIRWEQQAAMEAARPKITIDLRGLERIRRDAAGTRDSLLSPEEREEWESGEETIPAPEIASRPEEPAPTELPLDGVQLRTLRALLRGEDPTAILRVSRRMPSIEADRINEALYDEIGDTVLLCENDRLLLVEDYVEDLRRIAGGNEHG